MSGSFLSQRPGLLSFVLACAFVLSGCGGGGSDGAAAAKSGYAFGRISGFGSVVVNGVHYDETNAVIEDEDGQSYDDSELHLGMMAEIESRDHDESSGTPKATAEKIRLIGLMRGPVENVANGSIVVLGQTVALTATTVFGESFVGGAGAITPGSVVKVYGTLDTTSGAYTATRIEAASDAGPYKLRGVVTAYDPALKTLTIGTALIDLSGVAAPSDLAVGSVVRVKLQTTQSNGSWVATHLKTIHFRPHDNDHTEVEGTISEFTSATSFSVDGLPVDASNAKFEDGSAGLDAGVRVEVEGALVNGVLIATKVEIKSEASDDHDGFEVEGLITAIDSEAGTFVVRGVTIAVSQATGFVGGTLADLRLEARVEVHGSLAADGVTLAADRIEFKARR